MFGDAGAVVIRVEVALFEVQTQAANFRGLRKRTDSRRRPGGKFKAGALRFSAHLIRILTLAVLRGDRRQAFFYRGIMYATGVTTSLNRCAPFLKRRRFAAVQRIAQQRQFTAFLQRKGKPAFNFRIQTRFDAEIDRAVQQRAGGCYPQRAFAHKGVNLRVFFGQIGAPDITPVNQACGEQPVDRQTLMQFRYIIFAMNEVNM